MFLEAILSSGNCVTFSKLVYGVRMYNIGVSVIRRTCFLFAVFALVSKFLPSNDKIQCPDYGFQARTKHSGPRSP